MQKTGLLLLLVLQLASGAAIQGTVVENSSGRPLARALVTLVTIGAHGAGGSFSVRANSSGQFVFSELRAGAYLISASRTGFAPMRYGQKTWKAAGTPIFMPDAESNFVAELRLRRLGAIAGTVWDENQVGVPEQSVAVYQAIRPPRMVAKAKTDDRGVYRVGGLEPGH